MDNTNFQGVFTPKGNRKAHSKDTQQDMQEHTPGLVNSTVSIASPSTSMLDMDFQEPFLGRSSWGVAGGRNEEISSYSTRTSCHSDVPIII